MVRLGCLLVAFACLTAAAPTAAAERLSIRGRGWGHGVGMSQWGAYGFAQNGRGYREILRHYYTGTAIGSTPNSRVRVLLDASTGTLAFRGAARAARRRLDPSRTYRVRRGGATSVTLLSARGRRLGTYSAPLRIVARKGSRLERAGGQEYRGAFEVHPDVLSGINLVNALPLESYIRGVVARESPSSWPAEALKAQAVAARTYAITTSRSGQFDHFPDTRSQVYGGVSAETPTTDAAVRATAGEVVTHAGDPVITYFFSTSGGRTEDVENTPLGQEPRAWLKSVEDPYDYHSPKHKWTVRMTLEQAERKLGNLAKGDFKGIDVIRRGRSPRVVIADVIGSDGRTRTTGGVLRARLGLNDTWAYFTVISSDAEDPPEEDPPSGAGDPSGGTPPPGARMTRSAPVGLLRGYVRPGRRGRHLPVQMRRGGRWVTVGAVELGRRGRYVWAAHVSGTYRVSADGPPVRVP